jgi:hypothetical protein
MAVIGPIARYLLLAVVLVGSPAILLWSITAVFRSSSKVQDPPILVGAKHALKMRVAQGDMAPDEYERLRGLMRSLPLRTRFRARLGISGLRLCWIVWCVVWALFWALAGIAQLRWTPVALLLAPLSVAAAFLPVGRSKTEVVDQR